MNQPRLVPVISALVIATIMPPGLAGPEIEQGDPEVCTVRVFDSETGLAAAKAAIAKGEPRLLFMGLPSGVGVDPITGLPTASMGCIVTNEIGEYVEAHNAEIRRALHAGELDSFLYTSRLFTPESLREFVTGASWVTLGDKDGEARNDQGHCTVVRQESGGLCYLRVERDGEDQSIDEVRWRGSIMPPRGFHQRQMRECDPMLIAFTHDGKTAVFRNADGTRYFTYDLEHGRVIQMLRVED